MIENELKGKKILFFSVQTFNLEKNIIEKLQELGAIVTYYDERPSNSNFTKGIIRLKRSLYQHKIDDYYKDILEKNSNIQFDYLFVNRGEVITAFFLDEFKKSQTNCKFIFYTWDSIKNHKHPLTILKYFDKKLTFDSEDAKKYGLEFRPLFFLDFYKNLKENVSQNYKYDLLFLGTAHSDRYRLTNLIVNWCNKNNLISYTYFFIHSRMVFIYKKLFDKSFKEFDFKKMSFKSLSTLEILDLYKNSKVILDINHHGQKGLTMRTFECLGAQKKMITTNKEIMKYKFYNKSNILVIDRFDVKIPKEFFNEEYKKIDSELYKASTIKGWLSSIFIENESNFWFN